MSLGPGREPVAQWMDGRSAARSILAELSVTIGELAAAAGHPLGLAMLQVGDDQASVSYMRAIARCCSAVGVGHQAVVLPAATSPVQLAEALDALATNSAISGVIVQLPLPPHLRATLLAHMPPDKDIDGIHPLNAGLLAIGDAQALAPATPLGGMELLRRYDVPLQGARAVVVGRSPVVGRPLAQLLLQADATVTICHTRTRDLASLTREADILAVATGHAGTIRADMIRPGATVLDFGVNYVNGQVSGDVDPEAAAVASRLTPVPGGTGPMTNAMLVRNLVHAARRQLELS